MPKDSDTSGGRDSSTDKESGLDKSFVKKVKSRVSGFIPSSLSKWFGGSEEGSQKVRARDELEDDEESFNLQPPTKRQKKPSSVNIGRDALNFISTPTHHTQLSFTNFQEPAPSSSGIRSRKLLLPNVSTKNYSTPIDLHNGDKDSDSGESTSGYSSMPRIGSKEQVSEIVDKQSASTSNSLVNRSIFSSTMTHERTLFPERSISPQRNSSLSSRRPSFNASAFGSPNFMDRTLSTKRIVNSPFYGGRTTYGGASAYSHNLSKISNEDRSCLKTFVQAKPVNESSNKSVMLSKTAKRILDTLEQYTSPSEDVRKIPNPSTKRNHKLDNLSSKYTGANPYFVRDSRVPSNKELIVPTVTDLLKIKMKERLQDSTVSVREIATKSNSPLNTENYSIRTRETPKANIKNTNKIKTKVSSVREKKQDTTDITETVKLPNVQLPISKLPSFDFTIPSPFVSNKESNMKPVPSKEPVCIEQKKTETIQAILTPRTDKEDFKPIEYIFSKPLVLAENLKTIKAINNFKFSKPVCKKVVEQVTEANTFKNFKFTSTTTHAPTMHAIKKAVPKNNGESGYIAPAKKLETGSVMDVLGKKNDLAEKFKPSPDTWECSICLIRNAADKKKCAACETPRSTNQLTQEENKTQVTGFGDKFKITSDQWECTDCFVRNDANKTKCAACDSPKKALSAPTNTFGSQFKMSTDKWECSVCLVRNDSTKSSCVACTTPKPGSNSAEENAAIAEQFKPKVTYWECKTCLAKNDLTTPKCVACNALNPGPLLVEKKKNQWECPTCMVKNDDSLYKCQCCETPQPGKTKPIPLNPKEQVMPTFCFGIDKAQLNGHGFVFGIPEGNKKQSEGASISNNSFVFGETQVESKPATGFVFGIPNGTKTQVSESKPSEVTKIEEQKQFTFGVQNNTKSLKRGANDNVISVDAKKSDTSFTTSVPSIIPPINGSHENAEKNTQLNNSQPTSTSNAPSSIFNFAAKPSTAPIATPEKPQVATPEFKFGSKTKNALTKNSSNTSIFATTKSNNDSTHALNTNSSLTDTSAFGSAAKENSGFKFNAPTKTDTTPAPGVFTFSSSKAMADIKTPLFNAENKSENNTFNVANKTVIPPATQPSSTFNFPPRLPSGGFNFNASKNDVSFGTPSPAAPTFGTPAANTTFGTPAMNPPAFSTNTPSFAAQPTNPPAFGAPSNVPTFGAATTQAPAFGATNTTPAFGAPSGNTFGNLSSNASFGAPAQTAPNGMFNFGSGTSSATPKTGYNFGAAQAPPQAGGFSFTANHNMNPPAPSTGGFNFGAPPAAPTMNPDIKPTFNFTGGAATTTFTAQQSGEIKPRVIRKALRRTHR